ncbi:secretin receptor [Puma concolor]|uniref:Secretin receptor n=1 Tax=Puma concolor TaxID=9696 RepID=A0A6P6IA26_PUMCO|nr:secretin receptor [Puma concolor]
MTTRTRSQGRRPDATKLSRDVGAGRIRVAGARAPEAAGEDADNEFFEFSFPENVLTSLSFLEVSFAEYRILGGQFSCSTWDTIPVDFSTQAHLPPPPKSQRVVVMMGFREDPERTPQGDKGTSMRGCVPVLPTVGALPRLCDVLQVLREERDQCLQELSKEKQGDPGVEQPSPGCEGLWDNMSCWPSSALGQTVEVGCPQFLRMLTGRNGSVFRNCTEDGWSEAFPRPDLACGVNVNDSSNEKRHEYLLKLKVMYTVGYSSSLVMLLVALSVLCAFRRLHCTRNYIHMHLFVSFILRALSNFIKDAVLFSSDDVAHCDAHRPDFGEGGSPAVFVALWAISRHFLEDVGCWDINANESIWWVIRGPVILSILINFILFINILRILMRKLRTQETRGNEANHYKRLAKSTLLLIPLFGVHYIIFAFSPEDAMEVQLFFELALGSFQGLVVAVLYCFLNGEVQLEVQKKWRQWHVREFLLRPVALNSTFSNGTSGLTHSTKASTSEQSGGTCRASVI